MDDAYMQFRKGKKKKGGGVWNLEKKIVEC